MSKKHSLTALFLSFVLTFSLSGLSSLLFREALPLYHSLVKPPLAVPASVFPIVWSILYALMSLSLWRILRTAPSSSWQEQIRSPAVLLYLAQLGVNVLWPILFFRFRLFFGAFLWILLLIALTVRMIRSFQALSPLAAWLQIPNLLWLFFAAYLNFGFWLLNLPD